jgi:hypothetical protein
MTQSFVQHGNYLLRMHTPSTSISYVNIRNYMFNLFFALWLYLIFFTIHLDK